MRVAYFTESLPPLTDGVARTYTWLAKALAEAQVDFRFVSPCVPLEAEPWAGRVLETPWFEFPLYRYYRVGLPPWTGLFKALDSFRPDLVQVAAPTPLGWTGIFYARRRGIPVVSSYHTHFTDYFPYYGLGFLQEPGWALLRSFHNACARTYVPSASCQARLQGRGFKGLELWERGLDASAFSPSAKRAEERLRWAQPDEAVLLYVGRMVADKDLGVLAQALEQARARGLKARCVFAGDGPLRTVLAQRLPQDHFPGFVRGRDLARLYASADLFVFPSANETFGNVVLEAMASGLAVLSVSAGGPADLVQHGKNGWLVAPKDAAALAGAICQLIDGPGLRAQLAEGGLERSRGFHWRVVHGRLIESYQQVLNAHATAALTA